MDTVILAAGRGSRLDGIAAPFHKPLLVVNGTPLIRQCVERAMRVTDGNIVVVAAPDNASPIAHVLNGAGLGTVDIILQRKPMGPGHALLTGLKLVNTDEVLVLLGDNVMTFADIHKVAHTPGNAVGIEYMDASEAERFTRVRTTGEWVEKVPVVEEDMDSSGMVPCWVGPIKVNTHDVSKALTRFMEHPGRGDAEVPIGPMFNWLAEPSCVSVSSIDIGVPEALS